MCPGLTSRRARFSPMMSRVSTGGFGCANHSDVPGSHLATRPVLADDEPSVDWRLRLRQPLGCARLAWRDVRGRRSLTARCSAPSGLLARCGDGAGLAGLGGSCRLVRVGSQRQGGEVSAVEATLVPAVQAPATDRPDGEAEQAAGAVEPEVVRRDDDAE